MIIFSEISLGQESFSECYDSLHWRITHNTFHDRNPYTKWNECIKGKDMPYLSLQTVSGERIETKDLIGKVIVINLWFTSCHPCITELPALNRLVKEYGDKNVVFLGLSTDTKEMLDSDFFPKYWFDLLYLALIYIQSPKI